jgi:hypothetical protein
MNQWNLIERQDLDVAVLESDRHVLLVRILKVWKFKLNFELEKIMPNLNFPNLIYLNLT